MYGEFSQMGMFHGGGMIVWFVLLIVIFIVSMSFFKKSNCSIPKSSALDILKSRYAKGEITKDEFQQIKQDIV